MRSSIAAAWLGLLAVPLSLGVTPAAAQEKSATKPGFVLAPGKAARILVFRPSIKVGAQSTGGLFEPNAEWTDEARMLIGAALGRAQGQFGNVVIDYGEPIGADARLVADYQALFSVVAQSVVEYQFFVGNRLPTKKRDGGFDWTLGAGIGRIARAGEADYALFIHSEDQYGSTGRKVAQLFSAALGVGIISGVHKGYAGLVDLRTGDLVWLNADAQMGGDVRTPEGAQKRVAQLLEDFPGKPTAAAAR